MEVGRPYGACGSQVLTRHETLDRHNKPMTCQGASLASHAGGYLRVGVGGRA
jgi:hypothetical protein